MNKKAFSNPKVILYDDDFITYFKGNLISFENECQYIEFGTQRFPDGSIITLKTNQNEELDNIKLDETLMRRIAKFNKEQEIKRLDKDIQLKKKQIKDLEDNLKDKEKRWEKVKEYITKIYDIDIDEEE